MGHTLDELLDATGISDLEASHLEKNAGDAPPLDEHAELLKLAERCERAAAAPEDESESSEATELAEKTAAIAVIAKTLDEIEAVAIGAREKLASQDDGRAAAFIERALAAGHAPDDIARFMKQAGMLSQSLHGAAGHGGVVVGGALERLGAGLSERGTHHLGTALRDAAEHMSPEHLGGYLERLRARLGDDKLKHLVERSGAKIDHAPSVGDILPKSPKTRGVPSREQLKAVGVPAAAAVGGLAAGRALGRHGAHDDREASRDDARIRS